MFAVLVASVALYLPATRLRCAPVRLQLQQPNDDLKVGFSRGDDDGPKTSFAPANPNREKAPAKTKNEELMDEIQALMPAEKPAPKEAKPVDLNGIKPRDLLFGLPVESAVLLVSPRLPGADSPPGSWQCYALRVRAAGPRSAPVAGYGAAAAVATLQHSHTQARCDDVRRGVLRGGAVHAGLGHLLLRPPHRRDRPVLCAETLLPGARHRGRHGGPR
jgi:hypothetical protein